MMVHTLNIIILMLIVTPRLMTEEIRNTNRLSKIYNLEGKNKNHNETNIDKKKDEDSDTDESENNKFSEEEEAPNKGPKTENYAVLKKSLSNFDKAASQTQEKTPRNTNNEDKLQYRMILDKDTKPDKFSVKVKLNSSSIEQKYHLDEHTTVMDDQLFPFMVAVLKGAAYLCAGALIDKNWVLTAADKLLLMTETLRFLRIRLGSVNYKKGGKLLSVKYMEIHPYFERNKPTYDLALVMLSEPVKYTPTLRSVRLQTVPREISTTHFLVTSWLGKAKTKLNSTTSSLQRILAVRHVHPLEPEECFEELREIKAGHKGVICLETSLEDGCTRESGAPVVYNGVLWAVISPWRREKCDQEDDTPVFAALVSERNTTTWIHAVVHGGKWPLKDL